MGKIKQIFCQARLMQVENAICCPTREVENFREAIGHTANFLLCRFCTNNIYWLLFLGLCREPHSSDIVSKHIDTVEQLFSVVDQLEKFTPFSISALEKIFGCKFEKLRRCNYDTDDNISPWGASIAARGLNSSLIETVSADVIPNKTSNDGSVLMYLKSDVPITIDQVKQHFGMYSEIDTHPRPYLADDDKPGYFIYRKNWGLLIFDCPNGQKTVKQICLKAEQL